jgi:hypothetical protein
VAGIEQEESTFSPGPPAQKTSSMIRSSPVNAGVKLAWGKKPAEEYDYELTLLGAGVAYHFAANGSSASRSPLAFKVSRIDLGFTSIRSSIGEPGRNAGHGELRLSSLWQRHRQERTTKRPLPAAMNSAEVGFNF